ERGRQDDLRLVHGWGPSYPVLIEPGPGAGLSAPTRSVEGVRLAAGSFRYLHSSARWVRRPPADELWHLHRGERRLPRWQENRIHVAQGWRPGHLRHERRRNPREAADRLTGIRRGSVFGACRR